MPKGLSPEISAPPQTLPSQFRDIHVNVLWAQRDDLLPCEWNHPHLANNFWRVYHNDQAGGSLIVGDTVVHLERDGVYLVPAGLALASRNVAHMRQFFVHFDIAEIPPIILRELFPMPLRIPATPLFEATVAAINSGFHRLGYPSVAAQCTVKGIVYEAFGTALAAVPPNIFEHCWGRMSLLHPILPALQAIQDALGRTTTNAELAALCSLSEDHFIKTFRNAVGSPPAHYILKRRIATAAQRLLFTDDSIDRIAEETGFTDRFYFSRVFARETGLPPARYRKGPRA